MWPRRPLLAMPSALSRGRDAAVLVLVYPHDHVPCVVLTRRTETVQNHKGQISLPGGASEGSEGPVETALRETSEELAVAPASLEVVGTLTPIYVSASDYRVTPVVAISGSRPAFHPDPREVVEAIDVPLSVLLDPAVRRAEDREIRGVIVHVPFFAVGSHKVWGATAMILAEFAALLESAITCR